MTIVEPTQYSQRFQAFISSIVVWWISLLSKNEKWYSAKFGIDSRSIRHTHRLFKFSLQHKNRPGDYCVADAILAVVVFISSQWWDSGVGSARLGRGADHEHALRPWFRQFSCDRSMQCADNLRVKTEKIFVNESIHLVIFHNSSIPPSKQHWSSLIVMFNRRFFVPQVFDVENSISAWTHAFIMYFRSDLIYYWIAMPQGWRMNQKSFCSSFPTCVKAILEVCCQSLRPNKVQCGGHYSTERSPTVVVCPADRYENLHILWQSENTSFRTTDLTHWQNISLFFVFFAWSSQITWAHTEGKVGQTLWQVPAFYTPPGLDFFETGLSPANADCACQSLGLHCVSVERPRS